MALVGLYESRLIPVPVLLSVVTGVLGAFAGTVVAKLLLNLYGQSGMDVREAAELGAKLRFRAVMMTSINVHRRPRAAGLGRGHFGDPAAASARRYFSGRWRVQWESS